MTTIKTKTYTQDGVTAELWCYESTRIKMRWEAALLFEFKDDEMLVKTRTGANFACFVVHIQSLLFEKSDHAWAADLAAWWETNRALIEQCKFKQAWDAFGSLDNADEITTFIERAYDRTRRNYTPASEALRKDEADTQDEDFLAAAESA